MRPTIRAASCHPMNVMSLFRPRVNPSPAGSMNAEAANEPTQSVVQSKSSPMVMVRRVTGRGR